MILELIFAIEGLFALVAFKRSI